jgi:cytochrome c6
MKGIKCAILTVAMVLLAAIALSGSHRTVNAAVADGPALYKAKCAGCHGADGKGETPFGKVQKVRDLGSAEVQAQSDAELTEITAKGKHKMPGYEKSLGEDGVAAVVAHIRSFKH